MSRPWRYVLGFAAAAVAAASPLGAELFYEQPGGLVAAVFGLPACFVLLFANSERAQRTGAAAAALSAALAPAAAWPLLVLACVRVERGARRFATAGVVMAALIVGGVARASSIDFVALSEASTTKVVEAINAVEGAAITALRPTEAPFAGPSRYAGDAAAPLLCAAVLITLGLGVCGALRSPISRALLGVAAALAAAAGPALVGRPVNGAAIGVAPTMTVFGGLLLHRATGSLRTRPARLGVLAAGMFLVAAHIAAATARAAEHRRVYADPRLLWAARLAEPSGGAYRLDFVAWLRRQGAEADAAREEALALRSSEAGPSARAAYLLRLVRAGSDTEARVQWNLLPSDARPTDAASVAAVLAFLLRVGDEAGYFDYGAEAAARFPELHMELARTAEARGRRDLFARHVAAAMAGERPCPEAVEAAYRDACEREDPSALQALGARARALDPDAWVGDAALAKAAKIVRDDAALLVHGEEALRRNPALVDLHYDVALVYHGRRDDQERASAHYRRVLELEPHHPRRTTLESWIAALDGAGTGGGR